MEAIHQLLLKPFQDRQEIENFIDMQAWMRASHSYKCSLSRNGRLYVKRHGTQLRQTSREKP